MRFQDHLFYCPNIFRSSSGDVFVERINLSWLGCPYYKQRLKFTYLQRTVFNGDNNVMFQAINLLGDQVARITSSGMSLHQKWQIEFWTMYSFHNLINKTRSRRALWVFIYTRISIDNSRWRSPWILKFDQEPTHLSGGGLLGILSGGVSIGSRNPDPISNPKNVIFYTRFQTWPPKSISVFRPALY